MSIPEKLKKLDGEWRGTNLLYTTWIVENPISESASSCIVKLTANEKFLKIEYDWIFKNQKQDGLLLIGGEKDSDEVQAFWVDSWHMSDKFMVCDGKYAGDSILMKGFYKVPNHPDWGWRIDVVFSDENSFKIIMHNVSPEGEEDLAVEANYKKI